HMCPLPPDLVERLILLSTDPGDVIFDPFAGAGVVVAEAQRLGRRGLGIELVERDVRAYAKTTLPEIMKRNNDADLARRQEPASKFGIAGDVEVVGLEGAEQAIGRKKLYVYTGGHTWMTDGLKSIAALLAAKPEGKWPPILSNVRVQEKPRALVESPQPLAA